MSYLSYYASETIGKLDALQAIVSRCIESTGKISIPAIGRELGLGRQAVTYQLKLLERDRGVKIPDDRRYPQAQSPLKASVVPQDESSEPGTTNRPRHVSCVDRGAYQGHQKSPCGSEQRVKPAKPRKSISGLPMASLGKWYMKDVFGMDDDTGEHISLTKGDLE